LPHNDSKIELQSLHSGFLKDSGALKLGVHICRQTEQPLNLMKSMIGVHLVLNLPVVLFNIEGTVRK
jgi:hypothetical protein